MSFLAAEGRFWNMKKFIINSILSKTNLIHTVYELRGIQWCSWNSDWDFLYFVSTSWSLLKCGNFQKDVVSGTYWAFAVGFYAKTCFFFVPDAVLSLPQHNNHSCTDNLSVFCDDCEWYVGLIPEATWNAKNRIFLCRIHTRFYEGQTGTKQLPP